MSDEQSSIPAVEYREVPGAPGYFVDINGTAWSEWQNRIEGLGQWIGMRGKVRKQLKGTLTRSGYWQVHIPIDGRKRTVRICQLVLLAFVGPRTGDQVCRHLNCNSQDDRLENLSYGTCADNTNDTRLLGRFAYGVRHKGAKLTEEQVAEIRRLSKACGIGSYRLSKQFGVAKSLIYRIVTGKSWAHTYTP